MTRITLVGLDSPHVVEIAELALAVEMRPAFSVVGGVVVPASVDFAKSVDRGERYADELRQRGVPVVSSPEALVAETDLFFVAAVDSRRRWEHYSMLREWGKPIFFDTRLASSGDTGRRILEASRDDGIRVGCASPKRFDPQFVEALSQIGQADFAQLRGPLPWEPTHPYMWWYGHHLMSLLLAAFGELFDRISVTSRNAAVEFEASWGDGRTAVILGDGTQGTAGVLRRLDRSIEFAVGGGPRMIEGLVHEACSAQSQGPDPLAVLLAVDAAQRALETENIIRLN